MSVSSSSTGSKGAADQHSSKAAPSQSEQLILSTNASIARREIAFKRRIDEIFTEYPFYGYRKIAAQLHREEKAINEKTVAKYMREMGLMAIYPGPKLLVNVHIKQGFIRTC